ncbi:MAG: MBL fold metallo-hydrolase [Leptolyngbya sp.]|nr:MBL fold metallo-hydrolase [Candidatus Melainabacteria bacterium]
MKIAGLLVALTAALNLTTSAAISESLKTESSTGLASARAVSPVQFPGLCRFPLGDFQITTLSDGTCSLDLHELLLGASVSEVDFLLDKQCLHNPVEASVNSFLIQTGTKNILVDTGAGQLFGPKVCGKLLESLMVAGLKPEQIDDILITHVHTDHSGGLMRDGRMLFPNATIHVGKPDVDFFLDSSNSEKTGYGIKYFESAQKTLKPYVDAGKVKTFSGILEILPGITATLHPGHTPGSAFYLVKSKDQSIQFLGDVIHCSAVQMPRPDITIKFDVDSTKAAKVRSEELAHFAKDKQMIAAPHLPFPGIGYVQAEGKGYRWIPKEYRNRE